MMATPTVDCQITIYFNNGIEIIVESRIMLGEITELSSGGLMPSRWPVGQRKQTCTGLDSKQIPHVFN